MPSDDDAELIVKHTLTLASPLPSAFLAMVRVQHVDLQPDEVASDLRAPPHSAAGFRYDGYSNRHDELGSQTTPARLSIASLRETIGKS